MADVHFLPSHCSWSFKDMPLCPPPVDRIRRMIRDRPPFGPFNYVTRVLEDGATKFESSTDLEIYIDWLVLVERVCDQVGVPEDTWTKGFSWTATERCLSLVDHNQLTYTRHSLG